MRIGAQEVKLLAGSAKGPIELRASRRVASAEFAFGQINADDCRLRVGSLTPQVQCSSMTGANFQNHPGLARQDRVVKFSDFELGLHGTNALVEPMSTEQEGNS